MKYYKKLIGDRIYLAPKGTSDEEVEKFTEWLNDFQVTDFTGKSGQIITLNSEKQWLENSAMNKDKRIFNIISSNDSMLVVTVGLENFDWIDRSATLGIFIGDKSFRNQGYGT